MTVTNLPSSLSGESFQCVFGGFGSGELTAVSGDMFSCSVPNIPSFVGEGGYSSMCLQSVFVLCTQYNTMYIIYRVYEYKSHCRYVQQEDCP